MRVDRKDLFVVGDRVLVTPEKGQEKTRVGLLLPATAIEKTTVQGGRIVEVGPGTVVPSPADMTDEPWKLESGEPRPRYIPMEANVGDFALFLRNAAIEIEFEGETYLIVPHGAVLLLVREDPPGEDAEDAEFDEEHFQL